MARQTKKKKTAPNYSADTLALRIVLGLILIGLGVCVFLAVDMGMADQVSFFSGLRTVSFGTFGVLSYMLPFMLIWAGVLTVISSQRAAGFKPLWWACLAFFCLTTVIDLASRVGATEFFRAISEGGVVDRNYATSDWKDIVSGTYDFCVRCRSVGGAFGALVGWPLYRLTGPFLGCVLTGAGTLAAAMMACGLTPSRIRGLMAKYRTTTVRMDPEEERRQMEWQKQQAAMAEQRRREEAERRHQAERMAYEADAEAVRQWQVQQEIRRAAENKPAGHVSRIFGGKSTPEPNYKRPAYGKQTEAAQYAAPASVTQYGAPASVTQYGAPGEMQYAVPTASTQYTAQAGNEHYAAPINEAQPVVTAKPEQNPDSLADTWKKPNRKTRKTLESEPSLTSKQEPSTTFKQEPVPERKPVTVSEKKPEPIYEPEPEMENIPEKVPVQAPVKVPEEQPKTMPEEQPEAGTEETRPEPPVRPRRAAKEPEQIRVPVVQQSLEQRSWQPELKLPPKPEEDEPETEDSIWTPTPYNFPPITDLKTPSAPTQNNEEEDVRRSRKLEQTLEAFRVQARVVNVTHGPAISRFELELATGTKVNKVTELEKDIAYGMEAVSVRIEAPIPGKSLVGVEVPNPSRDTVTLREVLESQPMQNAKSILTVALGKDIAGTPIVCDLERMPHLLIAGATGSGKSVCINTIINSLLYRTTPDEVKMILIDPKVVELKCYNGIPHLLIPVVNEPRKAATALAWAVGEMMERYDRFSKVNVRGIEGYNNQLGPNEKPMPRIVVIIDELADLMMTCKKDVEDYICRLTQLARAAGIHLIVATQRPSVDVITGLIKANIPSRIAFKTASYTDSRTILDRNGSEQLLGWGDMLYLPVGSFTPLRIQGCFVSDGEVQKVTDDVRRANPCTYDPDVLDRLEELSQEKEASSQTMDTVGGAAETLDVDGSMFDQCVEMAIQDGQISTSTLQRRLRIGYSRAGRLTDQLEERGIISGKDGSKPRKCLITREEWEEIKKQTNGDAE